MSVFFRKLRINDKTNTATIIVTDKPVSTSKREINGVKVGVRTSSNITFGVLSLIDPETNKVMSAKHPDILKLQQTLNQGDEMPGFALNGGPVVDLNTGEETNLVWAGPAN
jgi:hypothetical protein|tara:strand:- start:212 stop:544 length:333 start_codon:yes stop_codon:yes gene_type:complete